MLCTGRCIGVSTGPSHDTICFPPPSVPLPPAQVNPVLREQALEQYRKDFGLDK